MPLRKLRIIFYTIKPIESFSVLERMAKGRDIQNELNDISQTVANLNGKSPFAIPTNYFDRFPQIIMQKIENEELAKTEPLLSPMLASLKEQSPFETPPHYFSQFTVELPETKANVFQIGFKKWMGYAAAACLGGMIFGLIYLSKQNQQPVSMASTSVSKEVIESYLNEIDLLDQVETEMEIVLNDENLQVDLSLASISEMLKDIPDKDISRFLAQPSYDESKSLN